MSAAHLPLQREALDAEALEEDTVRAEKEAALVGDEREDRRRSLMGAGPLLGQLHFLPSVEANGVNVSKSYCYCQTCRMQENDRPK